MRETITGVLHVILTPKRPRGESVLEMLLRASLEDRGLIEPKYYPPTYFINGPQTRADRLPNDGPHPEWRVDDPYQFRFKGRPKALSPGLRGHEITIIATVEPFHNHLGGYLIRPQITNIGGYVHCPFHNDPYDENVQGSARRYCRQRELDQ